jgi:hypothetical protein
MQATGQSICRAAGLSSAWQVRCCTNGHSGRTGGRCCREGRGRSCAAHTASRRAFCTCCTSQDCCAQPGLASPGKHAGHDQQAGRGGWPQLCVAAHFMLWSTHLRSLCAVVTLHIAIRQQPLALRLGDMPGPSRRHTCSKLKHVSPQVLLLSPQHMACMTSADPPQVALWKDPVPPSLAGPAVPLEELARQAVSGEGGSTGSAL